jgi:hypothetical protein
MTTDDACHSIPSAVPAGFRVEHAENSLRIKSIGRPAIWLNGFLILWLIGWTVATIAVYCNHFSDHIPNNVEKNSLGDVLGFTFFWVAVFVFLLLLNFAEIAIQLHDDHYEQHFGLACLRHVVRVERDSISCVSLARQEIQDDNWKKSDFWTVFVTGVRKRKMILLGKLTFGYSTPKQKRMRVMTTSEKAEATWLTTLLSNWSKPEIQTI